MYKDGTYCLPMDKESKLVRDVYKLFEYIAKPAICREYTQILPCLDNLAEMILTDPETESRIGLSQVIENYVRIMIKDVSPDGKTIYYPNEAEITNLYKKTKNLKDAEIGQSLERSLTEEDLKRMPAGEATWIRLLRAMFRDCFKSINAVAKDPKYTNEMIELKKEAKEYLRNDFKNGNLTQEEYDGLRKTYYKRFADEVKSVYDAKNLELPEPVKKMLRIARPETPQYVPEDKNVSIKPVSQETQETQVPKQEVQKM